LETEEDIRSRLVRADHLLEMEYQGRAMLYGQQAADEWLERRGI